LLKACVPTTGKQFGLDMLTGMKFPMGMGFPMEMGVDDIIIRNENRKE